MKRKRIEVLSESVLCHSWGLWGGTCVLSRLCCGVGATVLLFCLLGGYVQPLHAQTYASSITGVVTDPTGGVVPGAKVVARDEAKGFTYSTDTNSVGLYTLGSLPPSTYIVTVAATGFKTVTRPGITLDVSQYVTVDVQMTLGASSQFVTVTGVTPLLGTEDGATGQTVERSYIDVMPLVGGDIFDLAFLAPGVNPNAAMTYANGVTNNFVSNGGRENTNDILIDGASTTAPGADTQFYQPMYVPSLDAVKEFKVEQNGFGADKGLSGNTVLDVVMRSGTNHFHGTVYDFLENTDLNAINWFNDRARLTPTNSDRSDFGATFGGPSRRIRHFCF